MHVDIKLYTNQSQENHSYISLHLIIVAWCHETGGNIAKIRVMIFLPNL